MDQSKEELSKLIDHLFRKEAGKLVATITRIFGLPNIELAEDIVQDTLLTALNHWSVGNVPDNPAAWLTQVAKRKTLNELKRLKSSKDHYAHFNLKFEDSSGDLYNIFLDSEIKDSQLRMIFACCHPNLPLESQIGLTLKTLCGFSVPEVARGLMTNVSTINKRLYRAKDQLRKGKIAFTIPSGNELDKRLDAVCLTLYLLFNEGYNSVHPDTLIRSELCFEALRLAKLLAAQFSEYKKLFALLALMSFHVARMDARIDDQDAIILFEDQNRELWDKNIIASGIQFLGKASGGKSLSEYHLEAGIAAEHCLAKSFDETDWKSIQNQYQLLYQIKNNPIILLNLAIIKSKIDGLDASLKELEKLVTDESLKDYYLLHATKGIFCMKVGKYQKAKVSLDQAVALTNSKQEIDFLKGKIKICASKLK